MKLEDFYGMAFKDKVFHLDPVLDQQNLLFRIDHTPCVAKLIHEHGNDHYITKIAKRQTALKILRPLLSRKFLPYNRFFYEKAVNTASEDDRRYEAEDNLLIYALTIVTASTWRALDAEEFMPAPKVLRETPREERYQRMWDLLADFTRPQIQHFRNKQPKTKPGLLSKIFGS